MWRIFGVLEPRRQAVEPALDAMSGTLGHRAPGSAGSSIDGWAGLAMRRLSIIHLQTGDQRISSEDGAVAGVLETRISPGADCSHQLWSRIVFTPSDDGMAQAGQPG